METPPTAPPPQTRLQRIFAWWKGLASFKRILIVTWVLFAVLVSLRIHGSSIALSARVWAPTRAEKHALAQPILRALGSKGKAYRDLLMATPKACRADEYATSTLWALAQFTHKPMFPVRNTNLAGGQNMLLLPWLPVLHISNLAKPATWGYLLFGQEFGLAWFWWFPPFFCFSALLLLLRRVFRGETKVALVGAGWICGSAYTIAWSLNPAYFIGFAALTAYAAIRLLEAKTFRAAVVAGSVVGYAAVGFVLGFYPPWLIPLAYAFLAIFIGVVWRDHLYSREHAKPLAAGAASMVAVMAGLFVPWFLATRPELVAMANSVYPGNRRTYGADCSFGRLFGAFHNLHTLRHDYTKTIGASSEVAGFYLFYPLVLLATLFNPSFRARLDKVAWLLLGICGAMMVYCMVGLPPWLCELTLLSRSPGPRAQIAIGVMSIVLSLYLLLPRSESPASLRCDGWWVLPMTIAMAGIALASELALNRWIKIHPKMGALPWPMVLTALGTAIVSAMLLLGKRRWFALLLAVALFATGYNYNPVSVSFPSIEKSQLRQFVKGAVREERQVGRTPYWVALGGYPEPILGTVVALMGARSFTATLFHPQVDHWRKVDPAGKYETIYNRYSETHFIPRGLGDDRVFFTLPSLGNFNLHASPTHPLLIEADVRYAMSCLKDGPLRRENTYLIGETEDKLCRIWRLRE